MALKQLSTLYLAATTAIAASSAMAWESADGSVSTSASVALSSDYMWRGYSQTENEAAISGGFDIAHAVGLYAGVWASNVDFNDDASSEIDIYAGFANEIGDTGIRYDIGALRYLYDGENYDWNEYHINLSYRFFSIGVAYSGNVYASGNDGVYYNAAFDYELPAGVGLSAGIGYYDYDKAVYGAGNPDSAVDYHIGLSKELAGFGLDVTYYDTDKDAKRLYTKDLADSRIVFTISKSM